MLNVYSIKYVFRTTLKIQYLLLQFYVDINRYTEITKYNDLKYHTSLISNISTTLKKKNVSHVYRCTFFNSALLKNLVDSFIT